MNKKQKLMKRMEILRLFNYADRAHVNCIRINSGNTYEHELKKFEKAWELAVMEHDFLTEARFLDLSGRADLVDLDEGIILEIKVSEIFESIENKKKRYSLPIEVVE